MTPFLDALFAGPFGPLVIFCLRIFDVSLSTVRILLAVRGQKVIVPIIGFFEVLIWVFAVGNAIRHLNSVWHVLGYASGFATGTIVGLWIEERLAIGIATMRIITQHIGAGLASALRELGCGVTEFSAAGREGPVEVVFTVVPRRKIPAVMAEVDRWDPEAFITIEEPREIRRGWMYATPGVRTPPRLRVSLWARQAAEKQLPKETE
jgi:uncharacterized protein YebE (UPF0316 family)